MKTFTADPFERDYRGRWLKGNSGNRLGRPKGSRNRWRRADPARALLWRGSEWKLYFDRAMRTAQGDTDEKAAAAYAECQRLWRVHHPPKTKRGTCAQCGHPLNLQNPRYDGAPFPIDDSFVHFRCLPQFLLWRWEQARLALHHLGIE